MLVITRGPGESFWIGPDVRVSIVERAGGDRVRVGIEAPEHVEIVREELIQWTLAEKNEEALGLRS